jgi:hypothetical protein
MSNFGNGHGHGFIIERFTKEFLTPFSDVEFFSFFSFSNHCFVVNFFESSVADICVPYTWTNSGNAE